jgi:hypothetical protein
MIWYIYSSHLLCPPAANCLFETYQSIVKVEIQKMFPLATCLCAQEGSTRLWGCPGPSTTSPPCSPRRRWGFLWQGYIFFLTVGLNPQGHHSPPMDRRDVCIVTLRLPDDLRTHQNVAGNFALTSLWMDSKIWGQSSRTARSRYHNV